MFEPNIPYLVYAYGPPDNLWVSTCSPGGWMGSSSLEPELRYLRGERPTREDTASYRPQEDARADRRRFEASTGTICGKVRRGALRPDVFERVAFLPMAGYSPWSPDEAWPTGGGEFCHQVAPGKYYLGYRHSTGGNVDAAAFYPGVNELRSASLVEVKAGQTRSGLDFSIPAQVTHSVRGMVVVHDGRLAKQTVAVQLIDLDRIPGRPAYRREIEFGGWFPLSRVRYFAFDSVLPGRYVACTQAPGSGWLTTKVEIDVRSSSRTVVLDLLRK